MCVGVCAMFAGIQLTGLFNKSGDKITIVNIAVKNPIKTDTSFRI